MRTERRPATEDGRASRRPGRATGLRCPRGPCPDARPTVPEGSSPGRGIRGGGPLVRIHVEWGGLGIERHPEAAAVVVVDVLSFSTAVEVATGRGARVHPFGGARGAARDHAAAIGALCAGRRSEGGPSLSPGSLAGLEAGTHLLLPSPNGSRLTLLCGDRPTYAGCLRNASAVAAAVLRDLGAAGGTVIVLAAGERWPDGSLRPALEDWIGAGAIAHALLRTDPDGDPSPEAEAAARAADLPAEEIGRLLRGCVSGRELIERGWADDVEMAAALDAGATAPRLRAGAYRAGVA